MGEGPIAVGQDPDRLGRILDCELRGDNRPEFRSDVIGDRPNQRRPPGEAFVERRRTNADRIGYRLHRHGLEPSPFKEGSSGADDRVGRGAGAGGAHPATVVAAIPRSVSSAATAPRADFPIRPRWVS